MKAVSRGLSWLGATVGAAFLGAVVGAGVVCIALFWNLAPDPPTSWALLWGAIIGVIVMASMLWLFHWRQITVQDLWRAVGDFFVQAGKEPF